MMSRVGQQTMPSLFQSWSWESFKAGWQMLYRAKAAAMLDDTRSFSNFAEWTPT